jgi:hypothetical protein
MELQVSVRCTGDCELVPYTTTSVARRGLPNSMLFTFASSPAQSSSFNSQSHLLSSDPGMRAPSFPSPPPHLTSLGATSVKMTREGSTPRAATSDLT